MTDTGRISLILASVAVCAYLLSQDGGVLALASFCAGWLLGALQEWDK